VSINAESARYKQLAHPTAHIPADWPNDMQDELSAWWAEARERYERALERLEPLLGRSRAKESARFFLPYANEITLDVGFNFRSFAHFFGLRHEPDAQREIFGIAEEMCRLVEMTGAFTMSLQAFGMTDAA
jgi:thymidylate synthase ThyX